MTDTGTKKTSLKVLMCENSMFMREKLKVLLEASGCQVVSEAENGIDAVEAYSTIKPDLVTMDIIMPKKGNLDGIGALKEILKKDPQAKVLMVTAMSQKKTIEDCMAAGASGYLLKPVSQESVDKTVRELFYG